MPASHASRTPQGSQPPHFWRNTGLWEHAACSPTADVLAPNYSRVYDAQLRPVCAKYSDLHIYVDADPIGTVAKHSENSMRREGCGKKSSFSTLCLWSSMELPSTENLSCREMMHQCFTTFRTRIKCCDCRLNREQVTDCSYEPICETGTQARARQMLLICLTPPSCLSTAPNHSRVVLRVFSLNRMYEIDQSKWPNLISLHARLYRSSSRYYSQLRMCLCWTKSGETLEELEKRRYTYFHTPGEATSYLEQVSHAASTFAQSRHFGRCQVLFWGGGRGAGQRKYDHWGKSFQCCSLVFVD